MANDPGIHAAKRFWSVKNITCSLHSANETAFPLVENAGWFFSGQYIVNQCAVAREAVRCYYLVFHTETMQPTGYRL